MENWLRNKIEIFLKTIFPISIIEPVLRRYLY